MLVIVWDTSFVNFENSSVCSMCCNDAMLLTGIACFHMKIHNNYELVIPNRRHDVMLPTSSLR